VSEASGLETGRQPFASSECLRIPRDRATHHYVAALLSCGLPASRRQPLGLVPHGFGISRLVVLEATTRCSNRGHQVQAEPWRPSSGLGPTSEFHPSFVAPVRTDARTLTRFSAPSATHPSRSTTPRLCLPGSRCAIALTMCLGALLPRRTPWCPFNQARFRGDPSELDLTEIADTSRRRFPSCDWLSDRRSRHKACLAFGLLHLPRIGRPKDLLIG
jgi:hypothetical protein